MTFIIALVGTIIMVIGIVIAQQVDQKNFEEEELAKMSKEEKELYLKRKEAQKKEKEAIFKEAEKKRKIQDYEQKHRIIVENIPNLTAEQCIERAKYQEEEKIKRATTIESLNKMYGVRIIDDEKKSIDELLESALRKEDARIDSKYWRQE